MVPVLLQYWARKVLTLIGPLKSGLDTFRDEEIMVPVLLEVFGQKVVLTLIDHLKVGQTHGLVLNGTSLIAVLSQKSGQDPYWNT